VRQIVCSAIISGDTLGGETVGLYSGETIEQMAVRYPGVRLDELGDIQTASRAHVPPPRLRK